MELTFKSLVLEEQDTLDSMNLHHQLTVAQDLFICTDSPEEMLQKLLVEQIMFQKQPLQWEFIPFSKQRESLLWPGLREKLILWKDQLKEKFQMMFHQHFCIPILKLLFISISQLAKNCEDSSIHGQSKETLKILLFQNHNIGY